MTTNETTIGVVPHAVTTAPPLAEVHAAHRERVRCHYNQAASAQSSWRSRAWFYHRHIEHSYQSMILPGSSVLEIGSGGGSLLASVKPGRGVGVDLSESMIDFARQQHPHLEFICGDFEEVDFNETFDYIIINGTLDEVDDIQMFLGKLQRVCSPTTRIIADNHNPIWAPILKLAETMGVKMPQPPQNWLPAYDLKNLFFVSGLDVIRTRYSLLLPFYVPLVSWLANRILAALWPFHNLCLTRFMVARHPMPPAPGHVTCSVVVTCRDERDNIEALIQRTALLGNDTELIFSEGHSKDGTRTEIQRCMAKYQHRNIRLVVQDGIGQGDAMRKGFGIATGDLILWLEADLTTPPEEILKLYTVLSEGKGEFVNGSRLVYPMPKGSMRTLNLWGNRFFGHLFTWLLEQQFRDTLCGLKGLTRKGYEKIVAERNYFGAFDPFGDFELLFGSGRCNLKIVEVPVHYRPRSYGETKISRFRDGLLLLRMSWLALWRLKLS